MAQHLNDAVKLASNETRIQDFFRGANLDYLLVNKLLVSLLPAQDKLRLCLDRTEWDFGQCQVNVLLITAGASDIHVPLFGQLLDSHNGNSNAADRIALLAGCVALLGRERIEQCFQNLKGRRFDPEATHLRCLHKRRKLVALVSLAYAFCLGAAAHGGRQPIARKNHGHRAVSLSRHGLNLLRQLTGPLTLPEDPLARMAETIPNFIARQLARNQLLKAVW